MKKRVIKPLICLILCALLLLQCVPFAAKEMDVTKEIRVLFTSDIHSVIEPYEMLNDSGKLTSIGGYARLKTAIDSYRTDNSVLLDGGDFSMGSLFNSIFRTEAPDLTLMGIMGYDATTIGNHEFDYGPEGLAECLLAAKGDSLPAMLTSNLEFNTDEAKKIKASFDEYGAKDYIIIERGGIKIGVFGIIGEEAQSYTETTDPVEFADTVETSKRCVSALKDEGADIIVCLSHTGTSGDDITKSEDAMLASHVDGIDVIISGHSHMLLEEPLEVNDTLIVACGCYANYLGILDLKIDDGDVSLGEYKLVSIDDSIAEDSQIVSMIQNFKEDVQTEFLDDKGLSFDQVIAYATHDFTDLDTVTTKYGEYGFTNLITDAYLYEAPKEDDITTVSVIGAGMIRDTFLKGDVTVSDAYKVLSLGMGADGSLGYPLTSFYVTGKELKALCEVDVSVYPIMEPAQLYFSGVRYTYNSNRLIFNRVIDVETQAPDGTWEPLDEKETYRVVCSLYMLQMAGLITDTTHGILDIHPRDVEGNTIEECNDAILYDSDGNEMKDWLALEHYLESFSNNGGNIPEQYANAVEQKEEEKTTLITLFENSNTFAKIVYFVIVVLILIIIIIIRAIVKKVKAKRAKKKLEINKEVR